MPFFLYLGVLTTNIMAVELTKPCLIEAVSNLAQKESIVIPKKDLSKKFDKSVKKVLEIYSKKLPLNSMSNFETYQEGKTKIRLTA